MSLSEEITMLLKRVTEQDKEICRLKEEHEFLEEASALFHFQSQMPTNRHTVARDNFLPQSKAPGNVF